MLETLIILAISSYVGSYFIPDDEEE